MENAQAVRALACVDTAGEAGQPSS